MRQAATIKSVPMLGLDASQVWDLVLAYLHLQREGQANNKRTAERRVQSLGLLPPEISETNLADELGRSPNHLVLDWALTQARKQRQRVVFAELDHLPGGASCLFANDARGTRWWVPLAGDDAASLWQSVQALQSHIGKVITVFAHGALTASWREWPGTAHIHLYPQAYKLTRNKIY